MRQRDYNKLPAVEPPPTYVKLEARDRKRPDGSYVDNRRMGSRGGLPVGPSRDRNGSADNFREWQPGEFQRSYPKSDVKNAAWYKMHKYGRLPGTDKDGWVRLAGPPSPVKTAGPPSPVAKAAVVAAKKKAGRR